MLRKSTAIIIAIVTAVIAFIITMVVIKITPGASTYMAEIGYSLVGVGVGVTLVGIGFYISYRNKQKTNK